MRRRLLIPAGVLAVAVVAYLLLSSGSSYTLDLQFENAGQLVNGNLVTVGGVDVGTVKQIELARNGQADVRIAVTDGRYTPLHAGTEATIRISSLSSVANRSVQLAPGPNNAAELASGATIPATATTTPVEVDQVVSTLDQQTRSNLQDLIHGGTELYAGGAAGDANRTLADLNPAIGETTGTLAQLDSDQAAFRSAIVDSASLMSSVAAERSSFDGLLSGTSTLFASLSQKTQRISSVLQRAPVVLPQLSDTFARFQSVFSDLRPDARLITDVAPIASTTVTRLGPTLQDAVPAVRAARPLVSELGRTLTLTPSLQRSAVPALKSATQALDGVLPIVTGSVPYFPDVFQGLVAGFGGSTAASYDANGNYARVHPVLGVDSLVGLSAGLANLVPKNLKPVTGSTNRCPGGAEVPAPDGSNPRTGIQNCQPGQSP